MVLSSVLKSFYFSAYENGRIPHKPHQIPSFSLISSLNLRMFGFWKSPANKHSSGSEDDKQTLKASRRTASEPVLVIPDDLNDDYPRKGGSSSSSTSSYSNLPATGDKYKNDLRDSGGLENQSVQELENYAVYKSEETSKGVGNCLRIANDIRGEATSTLDMLHQQGEQITRTHNMCVDMDKDLSKGEKHLNNLGGMFSMPWKPKKAKKIAGPVITADNPSKKSDKEQRKKLGLVPKGSSVAQTPPTKAETAMQKIEVEKAKQDDDLSDLSNILGDLKNMASDMGSEIDRQNKALDNLSDDVDEMNSRVKGANQRARRLLGK